MAIRKKLIAPENLRTLYSILTTHICEPQTSTGNLNYPYMSLGYHHFFVFNMHQSNHIDNKEDYFIGGFTGDSHNNEAFKAKMDKLCEKLRARYGLTNYTYCWSPMHIKESIQRTPAQRYHTAVRKSENKTNRRIQEIKRRNLLFGELYIQEEIEKLDQRKSLLKKRYQQ